MIHTFTIDGLPPSKNTMWRHDGDTHHLSPEYARWRDEMRLFLPWLELEGDLFIHVEIRPENRRRDGHNCMDALLDALQFSKVVKNDRQFKYTMCRETLPDKHNPRTVITIGAFSEWYIWFWSVELKPYQEKLIRKGRAA